MDKSNNKIRALESDITKIKAQKSTLQKKVKQSQDKHEKWKVERGRELLKAKKSNIAKDREINRLKR